MQSIGLKDEIASVMTSNAYEALLEVCNSVMFLKGFKSYSHECVTAFISEILKEEKIARTFERYRRIRNRINYYGEGVSLLTAKAALAEVREAIDYLTDKYLKGL